MSGAAPTVPAGDDGHDGPTRDGSGGRGTNPPRTGAAMAGATAGGSGGIFDRLRDTDPRNDVLEGLAIRFGLALAVARVGAGLVEVLFPKLFLRVVGKRGSATDGAALGFRMKGGRDVGVGLATLGAAALGDRSTFAQLTAAGIVIDGVDGLAVAADEGAALRGFVTRFGAPLGYAVAAGAAVAAWVLGRDA